MTSLKKIVPKTSTKPIQIRRIIRIPGQDDKEVLRDHIQAEIENKSKVCSNKTYACSVPRLEGYEYCIRHILQDIRAPFKPCSFLYASGKKCTQAAPKHETKKESMSMKKEPQLTTFCFEHSRLLQLKNTRNSLGRYKEIETNEALLNELSHYMNIDPPKAITHNPNTDLDEEIDVVSSNVQPFVSYEQIHDLVTITEKVKQKKRTLDYASDSSSEEELPTLNSASKAPECDLSDNESIDSQDEDLLKHAGIYTTEEAVLITKQKLDKLQGLYLDQIYRLQHLLREKRRKYLHALRKERETLCSIHNQPKNSPGERKMYEKLKAFDHYHKRHGMEAVLYKKYIDKRRKAYEASINGNSSKSSGSHFAKCQFTEGGVKCAERVLPSCKFCRKHILEDKKQILFRACGVEKAGITCQDPIPSIFEDSTCVLHIKIAEPKSYIRKKYESESEDEVEGMDTNTTSCSTIKAEIPESDQTPIKSETTEEVKQEGMKEEPAT